MPKEAPRWLEITPSQFPHEAEGLARVRKLLPDSAPFRAWSNFEFRDGHGKWHEVDLLVLGRRRLHLVELKAYRGTLQGDDHRWRRDGKRAEDSPLKLARRKAQRLASKLQDELLRWAREHHQTIPDVRDVVPFVQESVYLHHEHFRCELPPSARIDLFGLDGQESQTGLPGIRERLLEPAAHHQAIGANRDLIIAQLLANIGVVQRRQREAGSWVIDEEPTDEGDGWQDWPAFHRVSNDRARIHFLVTAPGATTQEEDRVKKLGQHEYRVMSRLAHEGLLSPRDVVENDLGLGLVYPTDDRYQRLDLWLADNPHGIPALTQLAILRKVAETVAYAHDNNIVHRGLTPHAVHVRQAHPGDPVKVLVGDWQSAGTTRAPASSTAAPGVTGILGAEQPNTAAERLRSVLNPADADRRSAEAFQAPEGVWNTDAQRVPLDVFALGALAYYVLAGRPAAPDRAALRERLQRDRGLDLAADLPQVTTAIRALVVEATRPAVSERLADVPKFLEKLAAAERSLTNVLDDDVDALDAAPGALLAGRFELVRRLGAGSTAVGLLVLDRTVAESSNRTRVLKVAINDAAGARLTAEAEVLASVQDSRVVRLVEGPVELGSRRALVLESAGEETLAEVLRGRTRLSLDLLERWGSDLLLALAALDKAGVDHRDIKPANLGVRRDSRSRKGLVLFDFSLSRAGASALTAGTPPYLDPFLESPGRGRYDSAAERYSAAVVLFEMSSGTTPAYGDGLSDPASVPEEATVTRELFDPAAAAGLTTFFRRALAREAGIRFDTVAEMLTAWQSVFTPLPTTVPDDADALAEAAEFSTALTRSGLSARALSALEPYGVHTVGELVALDPVRLNRLSGVAEPTRKEVKARYASWRSRLGRVGTAAHPHAQGDLPDPITAAERLVAAAGTSRATQLRSAVRVVLGLDAGVDAFASQQEIGTARGVTRPRAAQQITAMQNAWADDEASRTLLDAVLNTARQSLTALGGVATVEELTRAVLAALPPSAVTTDGPAPQRVAAGLLRVAYDRAHELDRANADDAPLATRRRGGRIAVVATNPLLLDAADALGQAADAVVAAARTAGESVVPTARAAEQLQTALRRVLGDTANPDALGTPSRALRLGAALATTAELSGALELHHRELGPTTALALALAGVGGRAELTVKEVRDRVRARFPALPPLPEGRRLVTLMQEAGLALVFDDIKDVFRSREQPADTTGLESRLVTRMVPAGPQLVAGGHVGHRLTESASSRSFLALGVEGRRVEQAVGTLERELGAHVVDLTRVLIDALRAAAATVGIPWDAVQAADAEAEGTRGAQGLAQLVTQALPAVDAAIAAACDDVAVGTRPVLLTEAAPLARYGHLGTLSRWTDLATPRTQAVWLLVPQLHGAQGAMVDGRSLPLAAPGQYLRLDADWLDSLTPASTGASA